MLSQSKLAHLQLLDTHFFRPRLLLLCLHHRLCVCCLLHLPQRTLILQCLHTHDRLAPSQMLRSTWWASCSSLSSNSRAARSFAYSASASSLSRSSNIVGSCNNSALCDCTALSTKPQTISAVSSHSMSSSISSAGDCKAKSARSSVGRSVVPAPSGQS